MLLLVCPPAEVHLWLISDASQKCSPANLACLQPWHANHFNNLGWLTKQATGVFGGLTNTAMLLTFHPRLEFIAHAFLISPPSQNVYSGLFLCSLPTINCLLSDISCARVTPPPSLSKFNVVRREETV